MIRTATFLILAMVGHGLFMASGAHMVGASHAMSSGSHVGPSSLAVDDLDLEAPCFTGQVAVKSAPLPLRLDRSGAPSPDRASADMRRTLPAIIPPHRPANVARALLQVYRI